MKDLFAVLLKQLMDKKPCLLATIIESSGSTPRSSGAYMLIGEKGRLYGTIGGGNLEYQATLAGQKSLSEKQNFIYDYVLNAEHTASLGMICGGQCKVLFYYFAPDEENIVFVKEAYTVMQSNEEYYLLIPVDDGKIKLLQATTLKVRQQIIDFDGQKYYAEHFAYDGKVYIFGGGHLAQELVPLLQHLDFRCIVIDDRKEFASEDLFPLADKVILADFKKLDRVIEIKANDYVAVMTRGHLHDADVERFVLNTRAGYIGVVGSRKKAALTRDTLLKEGFTSQQLDRIITPIGIDIGSETPAEIAVSIAAQLIQERANRYI